MPQVSINLRTNLTKEKLDSKEPLMISFYLPKFEAIVNALRHYSAIETILFAPLGVALNCLCSNIPGTSFGYATGEYMYLLILDGGDNSWLEKKKLAEVALLANFSFHSAIQEAIKGAVLNGFPKEIAENTLRVVGLLNDIGNSSEPIEPMFCIAADTIKKDKVSDFFVSEQSNYEYRSLQIFSKMYGVPDDMIKGPLSSLCEKFIEVTGIDWAEFPPSVKRGVCSVKRELIEKYFGQASTSSFEFNDKKCQWIADMEILHFFGGNRKYLNYFIWDNGE